MEEEKNVWLKPIKHKEDDNNKKTKKNVQFNSINVLYKKKASSIYFSIST